MNFQMIGKLNFFFVSFLCINISLNAQNNYNADVQTLLEYSNEKYASLTQLYNGKIYENPYNSAIKHPFFNPPDKTSNPQSSKVIYQKIDPISGKPIPEVYFKGTVVYRGRFYSDVNMKYDLYDQQIIIKTDISETGFEILLINDFVSKFSIGDHEFIKLNINNKEEFYEIMTKSGDLTLYAQWNKERYKKNTDAGKVVYSFGKQKKELCLYFNSTCYTIKNNKSFINAFPKLIHKEIKSLLSDSAFNFKKCTKAEAITIIQKSWNIYSSSLKASL